MENTKTVAVKGGTFGFAESDDALKQMGDTLVQCVVAEGLMEDDTFFKLFVEYRELSAFNAINVADVQPKYDAIKDRAAFKAMLAEYTKKRGTDAKSFDVTFCKPFVAFAGDTLFKHFYSKFPKA